MALNVFRFLAVMFTAVATAGAFAHLFALPLTSAAAMCIGLTLVVFFVSTYPANRQTQQWSVLPQNWEALRTQWEYSHDKPQPIPRLSTDETEGER